MSASPHAIVHYRSPFGRLVLELEGNICHAVHLGSRQVPREECPPDHPVALWLRAYFTGHALPLPALASPRTPFQSRLRRALLAIPRGETRTYGELAQALRSSPRAVGQALGANPLPILIPCHRVVAARGLGGFGGGLGWKKRLLKLESAAPC
ncbi:MAG TPA: methylated-DNA--[protein]-cysteine S-methyltransferase [Mariprofundaceae bacterium]|nr:methylated-DNA--[protein]-cysteine S-methyltransferase [Mariprofundaceae bacterium]